MQKQSPILSVVIPVTRMAGRLTRLAANLLACKELEIEIIIVHDEQDSLTHDELDTLLGEHSNIKIKLLKQTVNAPGLARNLGIKETTGTWIAFWDADDLVYPEGYLRLISKAEENKADIGIGRIKTTSTSGGETKVKEFELSGFSTSTVYDLAYLPAFTRFVFRRDVFTNLAFPDYLLGEDLVFLANLNFLNFKIEFGTEVIYNYFINESFQVTSRTNLFTELLKTNTFLYQNLKKRSPKMRMYLVTQIVRINLSLLRDSSNRRESYQLLLKLLLENPLITLKSCYSLLRRRSEFQIR